MRRVLIAPMLGAAASASTAFLVYRISLPLGNGVGVLLAIGAAVLIYVSAVLALRAVTVADISLLPHSERLLGFLKKHRVIGIKNE